jgi:hypothetical protein
VERELEEEMAERRRKKLACFQKTQSGVVKKGATIKASTLVNAPFTLEELVHMIHVSVNSKYGADLEGITRTLTDSVKGSVESLRIEFKQELEKLLRQVRAMVQQVLGQARGKRDMDLPDTGATALGVSMAPNPGTQASLGRVVNQGGSPNLNSPQPYYQVHAYGPGAGSIPDAYCPRPPPPPPG